MKRQRQIQFTAEEQAAFLQGARKAALATLDKDGIPHVVAMGFLAKDGAIYMASYAKAQKVINVKRNPKVGLAVESSLALTRTAINIECCFAQCLRKGRMAVHRPRHVLC